MPGISRDNDTAVGDLIPSQTTVFANNKLVIVDRDPVTSHSPGGDHSGVVFDVVSGIQTSQFDSNYTSFGPKMIAGSNNVFIGGVAVVNAGDLATCGDAATGSANVNVGNPS
jgi:hypothetical protein